MKTGTVRVSEEFIKPDGTKKWFAHERQYNQDTEDPLDVFAVAEAKMNDYAKSSSQVILDNSNPYTSAIGSNSHGIPIPHPIITIERTSEDERIAELIRDIYACTEIDGNNGLLTYNKLASTCKEAQQAFDIMFRKLAQTNICS